MFSLPGPPFLPILHLLGFYSPCPPIATSSVEPLKPTPRQTEFILCTLTWLLPHLYHNNKLQIPLPPLWYVLVPLVKCIPEGKNTFIFESLLVFTTDPCTLEAPNTYLWMHELLWIEIIESNSQNSEIIRFEGSLPFHCIRLQ